MKFDNNLLFFTTQLVIIKLLKYAFKENQEKYRKPSGYSNT